LQKVPEETVFIVVRESKESHKYLGYFEDIFKQSNWKTLHFPVSGRSRPVGLAIGWRGSKGESYLALVRALKDANIEFREGEFEGGTERSSISFDPGFIEMSDYQVAIDRPN
jgi:hypothetical protein